MQRIFVFVLLINSFFCYSQQAYYFISFKDKDSTLLKSDPRLFLSEKSLARRIKYNLPLLSVSDLPLKNNYLYKLDSSGIAIKTKSKWLNGVIVFCEKSNLQTLKNFDFVNDVKFIGYNTEEQNQSKEKIDLEEKLILLESKFGIDKTTSNEISTNKNKFSDEYGAASKQIKMLKLDELHKKNFTGKDIAIAVIDAGFKNLNKNKYFNDLKITSSYDFYSNNENVFDGDEHGTAVISCMAVNFKNNFIGSAPDANYLLYRSETSSSEYPVEEYFWTCAAEMADSAGADIINTSLGYSKFDESNLGHNYKELNGNTTVISKAVNTAVSKGILVFVSAGNEGDNFWRNLTTPGDADSAITIAACDEEFEYTSFSSVGPTSNKKQKPDLAALGLNVKIISATGKIIDGKGTSYSCPIIAGAAACLLQANLNASPSQIKMALQMSATNYSNPDKFLGYGVPDLFLADKLLKKYLNDTLLDVQIINNKMHLTFYINTPQKVEISFASPIENEFWNTKEKIKKSSFVRIQIKHYKKIKQGVFVVKLKTNSGINYFQFEKK